MQKSRSTTGQSIAIPDGHVAGADQDGCLASVETRNKQMTYERIRPELRESIQPYGRQGLVRRFVTGLHAALSTREDPAEM